MTVVDIEEAPTYTALLEGLNTQVLAESEARDAKYRIAKALIDDGCPLRVASSYVGVTHQSISNWASRAK